MLKAICSRKELSLTGYYPHICDLIDSEELMAKAGIMALHDFGIEAKPEDFIPFVGRGEDLYIGGVARKYGHEYVTAMKDSAYAHYGDYVETEAFVPVEIPSILYKLRDLGYKIAVCTSADKAKVVHNGRNGGCIQCHSHRRQDKE